MSDHLFHVGPIGSLLPLPDRLVDVPASLTRLGGTHVSLEGNRITDTFGFKRSWSWAWENLLPWQLPYVEALVYGLVPGPLRLIDPRRTNRLPEQNATGGSVRRSARGWNSSAGVLSYRAIRGLPADPASLPAAVALRGAIGWQLLATGGGSCYPADAATSDGTWRTPVLPGEEIEAFCWATGPSGTQVNLTRREYSATGDATTITGPIVTLSATEWRRVAVSFTPAGSTVSIATLLTAAAATPPGFVFTTAWQIADPQAEVLSPRFVTDCFGDATSDFTGGWRPGGGAPVVTTAPQGHAYGLPGLHHIGLTLLET